MHACKTCKGTEQPHFENQSKTINALHALNIYNTYIDVSNIYETSGRCMY